MKLVQVTTAAAMLAAITLLPTPSVADSFGLKKRDPNSFLYGAISAGREDRLNRRDRAAEVAGPPRFRFGRARDGYDRGFPYVKTRRNYVDGQRGKHWRGYKRTRLPERCARTIVTRRGERQAFSARCLNRNFKHARRLPQSCEIAVRTNRGVRPFYNARCLRRDGWRVASR